MSSGCDEKAALVLMHNKVNGLLLYHSVQTTPVGTSAPHWFVCSVCVCVLQPYLKTSEEKMTETDLVLTERQHARVCVSKRKRTE